MRVTPGLDVWTPKKSLNSGGALAMSMNVAALMYDGKDRFGSRTKASPSPLAGTIQLSANFRGDFVFMLAGSQLHGSWVAR